MIAFPRKKKQIDARCTNGRWERLPNGKYRVTYEFEPDEGTRVVADMVSRISRIYTIQVYEHGGEWQG